MLDQAESHRAKAQPTGPPLDFQEHLANLEAAGLLLRIEREVNKDTELHPLVRWQFQGGLDESERRAFLFTNVVGAGGPRFELAGGGRRLSALGGHLGAGNGGKG